MGRSLGFILFKLETFDRNKKGRGNVVFSLKAICFSNPFFSTVSSGTVNAVFVFIR